MHRRSVWTWEEGGWEKNRWVMELGWEGPEWESEKWRGWVFEMGRAKVCPFFFLTISSAGPPVNVAMAIEVASIDHISEANMVKNRHSLLLSVPRFSIITSQLSQ